MQGLACATSFTAAVLFGAPCCSKPVICYHMPSLNTMYDHDALFLGRCFRAVDLLSCMGI
jgi:hypothetical protein